MAPAQVASGRCTPAWPKDALRISFGIIWLIDAVLKWLPGFRSGYMNAIMGEAQGQPGWLKPWFDFWINFQHPRVTLFAYLVAVVETLIALALIAGFARPSRYSADYYIEKRISWWWKIAETRRPAPAQAPTGSPTLATMSATTATNGTATESRRAT